MTDTNPALVELIAAQLPEMTADQVTSVMATWRDVLAGDPVGTVRRSDDGLLAHRVVADGIPMWRVTGTDGSQYNDLSPSLSWPIIHTESEDQQ